MFDGRLNLVVIRTCETHAAQVFNVIVEAFERLRCNASCRGSLVADSVELAEEADLRLNPTLNTGKERSSLAGYMNLVKICEIASKPTHPVTSQSIVSQETNYERFNPRVGEETGFISQLN